MEFDSLSSFVNELKTRNDIVSVVSKYVPLERKGRTFWGRCPFHGEKTPSFAVNEYDQFYHCFGCGVGGDVIKFVQEIESVDFMGAVHILADMAHMEVPSFSNGSADEDDIRKRKEEKDRLVLLMKETATHYVENLKLPQAKPALAYLEKRNISPQLARTFGLGFSLNFSEIIDHLTSKGFSLKEMEQAGVVKFKDNRPYDAIGGRLVFPIIDSLSNVIAFCGRTLEPKPAFAKYLNTAETTLFSKGKNLYAINLVKKQKMTVGKIDYMIVVEGQMDVVSLHKSGFNTAVASMGTALTGEQAKLIKRFSDKVYICYDGDTAGKKATLRGLDILKDCGLDVYVMSMPESLDPDDVINKYGSEGYQKLINRALPLIDFKLEFLAKLYDVSTSEGKTKFLSEALDVLRSLNDVEKEVYMVKVSQISGVLKDFIKRQLEKETSETDVRKTNISSVISEEKKETREKVPLDNKVVQAEKFVLSALLHRKPYAYFKKDISEYFSEERSEYFKTIWKLIDQQNGGDIVKLFYDKYNMNNEDTLSEVDNVGSITKSEKASEIINYILKNSGEEYDLNYFKDCVYLIYKNYAERKIAKLLKDVNSVVEKEKRDSILNEIKELTLNIKNKKVDL